ncbi:MAG: hypothetical protein H3Z52_04720 [archaeon]|nr:hypothetical protein [archaeon]
MLFSEQVRIIADEENNILNDTTTYSITAVCDWTTKVTKVITLTKEKIVYAKIRSVTGTGSLSAGRILLDGVPLIATGAAGGGADVTREVFVILPAGSYTFEFQISMYKYSAACSIQLCHISAFNFSDKSKQAYDSGYISCPATSTTTLIDQNFTTPSARKLAVGSIKKYVALIFVNAERQAYRASKIKNPGESDTANFFNWKILINDIQESWTARQDDYYTGSDGTNPTYEAGSYGLLIKILDPNTTYNLKLKNYNGYASAYNGRVTVRIVICPWIFTNIEYEPVALDFPQGSTLYVITEPLTENPTKSTKIGKKRFVSFGDTTDYYSTASGTGILSHTYTFEIIEVANSLLLVSEATALNYACISVIAVDVR